MPSFLFHSTLSFICFGRSCVLFPHGILDIDIAFLFQNVAVAVSILVADSFLVGRHMA